MKKFFVSIALVLPLLTSCTEKYEVLSVPEDVELRKYLTRCVDAAYETHEWMQAENLCSELDCCWEFVPENLRAKYESGSTLTVEEMESIVLSLEYSPSYLDTLDEYDEFVDLYYYRLYGKEWFDPNYGYDADDLNGEEYDD